MVAFLNCHFLFFILFFLSTSSIHFFFHFFSLVFSPLHTYTHSSSLLFLFLLDFKSLSLFLSLYLILEHSLALYVIRNRERTSKRYLACSTIDRRTQAGAESMFTMPSHGFRSAAARLPPQRSLNGSNGFCLFF